MQKRTVPIQIIALLMALNLLQIDTEPEITCEYSLKDLITSIFDGEQNFKFQISFWEAFN